MGMQDGLYNLFQTMYCMQLQNQRDMCNFGMYEGFMEKEDYTKLPFDNTQLFSYHVQQLISEIGEVLAEDKRWKNFRNGKYNKDAKLEEIADCFIVLLNIAIFSGFYPEELVRAITEKINKVHTRIVHTRIMENKNDSNS